MLELLEGVVEKIDWSTYPKPIVFQSKELRGVLSGRMMPGEQHLEAS
jgi:hypothetical protein